MEKKRIFHLLLAFLLGVVLTILFTPNEGRYVEYNEGIGPRLLDTRTGRLYAKSDKGWILETEKVGYKEHKRH